MCGYVFIYDKKNNVNLELIKKLTEKITHRGPDDSEYYIDKNIAMGFKRLSIIDLENGKQPFKKDNCVMVFNGEIYNYQELRKDLEDLGYSFATQSDTETLLTSYIHHKDKCIDSLRGMYSFMIYDRKENRIFGARDEFGIKPLYYIENEKYIAFSSEYKALIELLDDIQVDEESFQNYLSFQYVPRYKTMIKGINKVPNGSFFTIQNGKIRFDKFQNINFTKESNVSTKDIYNVIKESVNQHVISNVELGVFLSGGIDSTIIATLLSKINPMVKSFSVGFDVEGYNELEVAKKTAENLKIENIQIKVTQDEYIKALPSVIYNLDDPLADPSCVGLYFLSKEAKKHVKVILSGEGADEIFGGYNIYKEYYSLRPFLNLPIMVKNKLNPLIKKIPNIKGKNYLIRATTPLEDRYIGNAKIFENSEVKKVMYGHDNCSYTTITKELYDYCKKMNYDYITTMQYIDINTWLEGDILLKGDKMSMANSIELRVPYLDKEVFKIAKNLNINQKATKSNTKVLLRKSFDGIIPDYMVEKKKLGFPTPIRVWLKEELGEYVKNIINISKTDYIVNKEYVFELLDEHIKGDKDNSRKVWTIFIFCMWHMIFIEQIEIEI